MIPVSPDDDAYETELDRATSSRLARLRTLPVDTSRVDRFLRQQIPQPGQQARQSLLRMRPFRAVAASIAVLATIGAILLASSGGPALASSAEMAQLHEDLVAGRIPTVKVHSIAEANRALADQSPQLPAVPDVPRDHVMACCMRSVKSKKLACVLMQTEGGPVTMTVANAADMRLPAAPAVVHSGVTYRVQKAGSLNMVMTERSGRWVCLIGQPSAEQLMDLAGQLQF